MKTIFPRFNPEKDYFKYFTTAIISGGLVGALSLSCVYPIDLVRLRMAADLGSSSNRQFQGISDCLEKVYNVDGIRGLYKGWGISVAGIIVYRGLYFGLFDSGKALLFENP